MFLCEYKFQTQKGEESALQNSGDICQRCFVVTIYPFQSHAGSNNPGVLQSQVRSNLVQLF